MRVTVAEEKRIKVKFVMTARKPPLTPNRSARIRVKIQGKIDPNWMQNYQGISAHFDGEVTTLNGTVPDQAALRGLLCTLWDFNLTVLSVELIDSNGNSSDKQ